MNFTLVSKETRYITKSVKHADVSTAHSTNNAIEKVLGKETRNKTFIQKKAYVN